MIPNATNFYSQMDTYQEDIIETQLNDLHSKYLNYKELSDKLDREDLIFNIIDKSQSLSHNDKIKLGDQLLSLADEYGVKYYSVTIPEGLLLFPINIYQDSLQTLSNILSKCHCGNHQGCGVNLDHKYTTTDSWFLHHSNDHSMSNPQRITELASELDCPYQLLIDDDMRIEIIDWVDTHERLQWCPPPKRRQYFLEDRIFHNKQDVFDPNSDVHTLFNQYVEMVKLETNERDKIHLLERAHEMIRDFGTSDAYFTICLDDIRYAVPYSQNKDSIDMLFDKFKDENTKYGPNTNNYRYCRCGQGSSDKFIRVDQKYVHKLYPYKNKVCKRSLDTQEVIIHNTMVGTQILESMLEGICPYTLFDSHEGICSLFLD